MKWCDLGWWHPKTFCILLWHVLIMWTFDEHGFSVLNPSNKLEDFLNVYFSAEFSFACTNICDWAQPTYSSDHRKLPNLTSKWWQHFFCHILSEVLSLQSSQKCTVCSIVSTSEVILTGPDFLIPLSFPSFKKPQLAFLIPETVNTIHLLIHSEQLSSGYGLMQFPVSGVGSAFHHHLRMCTTVNVVW